MPGQLKSLFSTFPNSEIRNSHFKKCKIILINCAANYQITQLIFYIFKLGIGDS
jgi:hypothetical protein